MGPGDKRKLPADDVSGRLLVGRTSPTFSSHSSSKNIENVDVEQPLLIGQSAFLSVGTLEQQPKAVRLAIVVAGALSGAVAVVYAVMLALLLLGGGSSPSHNAKSRYGIFGTKMLGNPLECGFHDLFRAFPSNETVALNLQMITSGPHLAGTQASLDTATYLQALYQSYGLDAHVADYTVLLSYPGERSLAQIAPALRVFALDEGSIDGDPFSANPDVVAPYLAYVRQGNATGKVVYANFGQVADFERLAALGVNVTGAVVLMRYRKIYRGDKVFNAAAAGAAAALIFSDPEFDAKNLTEGVYPDSKWLPPRGVQRGSTIHLGGGDPTTPGWPATPDCERLPESIYSQNLPSIPALPISYGDATPILNALGGQLAPREWWGGINVPQYHVGPGPAAVQLSLKMEKKLSPVRNAIAIIHGSVEPERYIILGNHHDAWTYGAVDPNSGTAAILEVAKGFGELLKWGWKPRRTIIFGSWDAEEMGLMGSTEWAEDNEDTLRNRAVAYLNVDCAVLGRGFLQGGATPQLDGILLAIAAKVKDPDFPERTLYDTWLAGSNMTNSSGATLPKVSRLGGSGSDYAAFLGHLGIAAVDLTFADRTSSYPMYHTMFDDFNWFSKFGDPGFHRITAMATLWGLLALRLADDRILPFDYSNYAEELRKYSTNLAEQVNTAGADGLVSVQPIISAVEKFAESATAAQAESKVALTGCSHKDPVLRSRAELAVQSLNDRLMLTERAFISPKGIPGRPWFRHLIYAPAKDNGYGSQAFPAVADAITSATSATGGSSWEAVQHEIHRAARAIVKASRVLSGALT